MFVIVSLDPLQSIKEVGCQFLKPFFIAFVMKMSIIIVFFHDNAQTHTAVQLLQTFYWELFWSPALQSWSCAKWLPPVDAPKEVDYIPVTGNWWWSANKH